MTPEAVNTKVVSTDKEKVKNTQQKHTAKTKVVSTPVPRKIVDLPEPKLVPWLKKGPDAKKSDHDSTPKFLPRAPYKDLFEKIKRNAQATAFTTEMDMESLNVYYRCVLLYTNSIVYFISN